jgi:hypothetical protein
MQQYCTVKPQFKVPLHSSESELKLGKILN